MSRPSGSAATRGDYIVVDRTLSLTVECIDGLWWNEVPLPRPWHRCWAQTRILRDDGVIESRCACGGYTYSFARRWGGRNGRRGGIWHIL